MTKHLDQKYGDLYSEIQELEFYFISVIEKEVLSNCNMLLDINELVAQMDAYISLCMSVQEYNLVRP